MKLTIYPCFLWVLLSNMVCHYAVAQFGSQQIISIEADGVQTLFVADLNGDNFKDVVSANRFENSIAWYKHLDGQGSFGPEIEIAFLNEPKTVVAADVDGDNDLDVLANSLANDSVLWYENTDGLGTFDVSHGIFDGTSVGIGAYAMVAADLDGDNDLDVAMASNFDGVSWFENLDGLGNFGSQQQVSTDISVTRNISAVDIDGDNDLDLVANGSGANSLYWFENLDGMGDFSTNIMVANTTTSTSSLFCADLDGDNDIDIITAMASHDLIAWHENLDGQGTFGPEQVITDQAVFAISVYAADLDNDNDMDVISGSSVDGKVAWFENMDGLGDFSSQNIITESLLGTRQVFAADLDNDTDMDVLSASQNDDKLAWYENTTIAGVEDNRALAVRLVPNPVDDLLTIQSHEPITRLTVYGVRGEKVMEREGNLTSLNVAHLPSGLFFFKLEAVDKVTVKKVIKR
ncbi:MAG: T9SS type A sorting domain-containing protein [Flavobacteriaceae bacterium]|nr:T9SS type A sorting domain-containing protein [Flavobacteriaceae bacterium]